MSCERCGAPAQGRLCADCEQMDRVETAHEHRSDGGSVADTADVIQGRLGWERGDISEADPSNLRPHPKNAKIYGDTDDVDDLDATFKESIAEKGVLERILITNDKKIISGHRRWLAAKDADLESVPVEYAEYDDKLTEREAVIEHNRHRKKTPGQIVNEFDEMLAIERERAEKRNSESAGASVEKLPQTESGKARDIAAEKIDADVSGRTLEKGKKVKDKAESDDEPEPVREAAQEAWDGLQSGEESFNSAYESVRDTESKLESEADTSAEPEDPEPPSGEYDVIYADPPWRYDFSKTSNRRVENKYQTMTLSEIKNLDVPSGDDGVLYLWATAPKLTEAIEVLREWGFEYTTNLVWDKEQMGMGYWSRVQHEHLLIGTRGDVSPPEPDVRRRSVVREEREEHSAKPDAVADMIAEQHTQGELIELFARDTRSGWDVWGNEVAAEVADD